MYGRALDLYHLLPNNMVQYDIIIVFNRNESIRPIYIVYFFTRVPCTIANLEVKSLLVASTFHIQFSLRNGR